MIVVFGGQKGGTWKSTLCFNVAAERAGHGRRVLIVDTDEQLTSAKWAERRRKAKIAPKVECISLYGEDCGEQIKDMLANYDDILVDCHGGMTPELISAMSVADKLFSPTQTTLADIDTLPKLDRLIPQVRALNRKLLPYIVITGAKSQRRVDQARLDLAAANIKNFEVLDCTVYHRAVFGDTSGNGMGVHEIKPRDQKAVSELLTLADEVWK